MGFVFYIFSNSGVRVLYLVIVGSTFSNSGVRVLHLVIVGFVFYI